MVKRVSKRVSEIVFLIAAGGSTYYLIEIWFRGFSHWTMFVLGGVALTFCSFQGEVMHWSEPMWIQKFRQLHSRQSRQSLRFASVVFLPCFGQSLVRNSHSEQQRWDSERFCGDLEQ